MSNRNRDQMLSLIASGNGEIATVNTSRTSPLIV
jgi:hypothetical protein